MIWGDRVDPGTFGKPAAPLLVVPVSTGYPCARGNRRGKLSNALREFRRRSRVTQLNRGEPETAGDKVDVRVNEARCHQTAFRIDDAGRAELPDLGRGADGKNGVAADRDRVGPWPR
jgi:hypothetical protein